MSGPDTLRSLARLATEAGSPATAREAAALADRLAEGRFYVACVGQFKRGKSTLLNALVGEPVLPTGVVPVTAAVTVLRHGPELRARVRFADRDWEDCDPRGLETYVSEEHNPANEKGVTGVEVFVPHPLLESGLCLVDTPGLGSISEAGTAATRAFVPHIDAALVVLGADPPITRDELALVREVAQQVDELIVVVNKADRTSDRERAEAIRFTERVLREHLRRPVGRIFEVSALERLHGGPPRDWEALSSRLATLAQRSGADLVTGAEQRGLEALLARLQRELLQREEALLRPVEESRERLDRLRRLVAEADAALAELGHRLTAVQERLSSRFLDERKQFFDRALPAAQRALLESADHGRRRGLRRRLTERALEITRDCLASWKEEQEPRAEALYQQAVTRFVALVNEFQEGLRSWGLEDLPPLAPDTRFRARSGFYFTGMLTVAPESAGRSLLDLVRPREQRRRAIERDALRYLERLFEVNTARITNDFRDRVMESRRLLEREMRARLREVVESAERAARRAREIQAAGAEAVRVERERLRRLRTELERLRPPREV